MDTLPRLPQVQYRNLDIPFDHRIPSFLPLECLISRKLGSARDLIPIFKCIGKNGFAPKIAYICAKLSIFCAKPVKI